MLKNFSKAEIRDLRQSCLQPYHERSLFKAIVTLIPTTFLYSTAMLFLPLAPWWLMPIVGLTMGLIGGVLFVIAHDASHDAFTPYRWLNALIGRVTLLPSWTTYTGWVHGHNHVHHGCTNLCPKDAVWAPISKADYDSRSRFRKAWYRHGRTLYGMGFVYLFNITLGKTFLIQPEIRNPKVRRRWFADCVFLVTAIIAQAIFFVWFAKQNSPGISAFWVLLCGTIIPILATTHGIALITMLQHTHPQVPWFNDPGQWSFYQSQILTTPHTHFIHPINPMLYSVMEHTAHHLDAHIPCYNLAIAQFRLEQHIPGEIVQHRVSTYSLKRLTQICQLYDFDNHRWLDYSGEATSSQTYSPEQNKPKEPEPKLFPVS